MAVRKLLICDDDADLREMLVEQLAVYDEFEVSEAETAARAVALTKTDRSTS